MAGRHDETDSAVKERAEIKNQEPTLYNVILLNDDYTTMEFVMEILETLFQKSPAEAYRIMMHVHRNGRGLAGVYTWEVAETKAEQGGVAREGGRVTRCARRSRKPDVFHRRSKSFSISRSAKRCRAATPISRSSICCTHWRTIPTASAFCGAAARICRLLRRKLSESLDESVEALPRGQEREPEQTAAFRRALQAAVLHVQSAQRQEAQVGDLLAAILQQPQTRAAALLAEQGITRLDVLEYLAHGITKTPIHDDDGASADATTAVRGSPAAAIPGLRRPGIRCRPIAST